MNQWKILKSCCFSLLLLFFSFSAQAQSSVFEPKTGYFDCPVGADLVSTKDRSVNDALSVTKYEYVTDLSSAHIISFYRTLFAELGFREVKNYSEATKTYSVFLFTQGFTQQVLLTIYESNPYVNNGRMTYYVTLCDTRDVLLLSRLHFQKPQPKEEVPIPFGAIEGLQVLNGKPTQVPGFHTYLVQGDVDDIVNFYLKDMLTYGWKLESNTPYEGKSNLFDVYLRNSQRKKMFSGFGINTNEFYPGIEVDVKGTAMQYKRGKEICFININQFRDPPEVLKQMRINPEPLQKYGNICIYVGCVDERYNEKYTKDLQNNMKQGGAKDLLNFLGH